MKKIKSLLIVLAVLIVSAIACACETVPPPSAYTVTFPTSAVGYTVTGDSTVNQGSDYTFTVEIANGYEASSDFAVKVNGNEVVASEGVYTVASVSENLTITVEGVVAQTFSVTLPQDSKYTVTGNASVTFGNDYTFTVEIANGYEASSDFAVKVNGNEVVANEGTYTVASVSENLTITVDGVVAQTFAVTLTNGEGYTVSGNATATFGSNYTFTVEIATGYEKTSDFVVKVNGVEVSESAGVYTVEGVVGELNITVEGIVYSGDINLGEDENENTDDWFGQN